jgi:hypothetical protein
MSNIEGINLTASVITILLFIHFIFTRRKFIISKFKFLLNFREIHKTEIQNFDKLLTPYKEKINTLWEAFTNLGSVFSVFAGSVISFVDYNIEGKTFLYSLFIFIFYYGVSLWLKIMERTIRL